MIDYKELLRKYIDHVSTEEGTTFINKHMIEWGEFSEEEFLELETLKGGPTLTSYEPLMRSPEWRAGVKELLSTHLQPQIAPQSPQDDR